MAGQVGACVFHIQPAKRTLRMSTKLAFLPTFILPVAEIVPPLCDRMLWLSYSTSKTNFANEHKVSVPTYFHFTSCRNCSPLVRQDALAGTVYRIPQIYQSIFQINRPEIASHLAPPPKRKTVYSEPCHVLRGEKCPDASRMFALKYRVRRDLNTDVSVCLIDMPDSNSHQAGISL